MDLSIIIVNYNTKELTKNCIDSIFKYVKNLDFEVIVVDNNSSDGSQKLIQKEFPQVILIANDKNVGFGNANNQAMEIAKSSFLLLLNSDTCMTEEGITDIYEFAKNTPDAAIVGGKIYFGDNSLQYSCRRFANLLSEILMHSVCIVKNIDPFGRHNKMMDFDHNSIIKIDWVSGAYMLIKKNCLEENYIFDPRMFMYSEDKDLCRRLKEKGYGIYYFPGSTIYHYHGQSVKSNRARGNVVGYLSSIIYVENHYNKPITFIYRVCILSLWVLIKGTFSILAVFSKNAKIHEKKTLFTNMIQLLKKF